MRPQLIVFSIGPIYYFPDGRFLKIFLEKSLIAFSLPSAILVATIYNPTFSGTGSVFVDTTIAIISGTCFFFGLIVFSVLHLLLSQVWLAPGYTPIGYFGSALLSEYSRMAAFHHVEAISAVSLSSVVMSAALVVPVIVVLEQVVIRFFRISSLDDYEISRITVFSRAQTLAEPVLPSPGVEAGEVSYVSDQGGPDNASAPLGPPKGAAPIIRIGDRSFRSDELRLLEAEEHYLRVTSANGVILVKEKISVACAEIPEELGMRVHRSFWVAYAETKSVVKLAPGRYGVETAHLGIVALSRGLKEEFRSRHEAWRKANGA
ncbi:LytTR family DNA-binding domain-containing protein [Fuscovulum blasticum]|uniref:LytTR family DNA-binding domain-containing protein n=1 Tax=Fuscovulum blasticum TaxID=1075 RepID=UPI0013DF5BE8|nr:LytTR family DNA-binding domain-containing protein [Fuscovulum blasticum]